MSGKDHDTKAEPGFVKRRNRISGQFRAHMIEMIESPAWRTLSLSARRVIDRIEIELAHHGGNDNGRLPVTFEDFEAYGIHHDAIAPAIREAGALGFIRVMERGRGGNAEYRQPNKFFLTFAHCRTSRAEPPAHDWRKIKTIEEAETIARAARNSKDARAVKFAEWRTQKTKHHTRKSGVVPHPQTRGETVQVPPPESGSTVSLRKPGPLSISWVRGRYPRAQSTPQWTGYTKLPLELRMMALGLPADGAAA
jgi:hypothetical protein